MSVTIRKFVKRIVSMGSHKNNFTRYSILSKLEIIVDNGVAFIQGPILIQKVKNHIALKILELLCILLLQVYSWI